MKKLFLLAFFVAPALVCMSSVGQADVVNATFTDGHVIQHNFEADAGSGASDTFIVNNSNGRRLGSGGGGDAQRTNNPVFEFTLPTLTGGDIISGANFGITFDNTAINGGLTFDGVVSLMNYSDIASFDGADASTSVGALGNGSLIGTWAVADATDSGTLDIAFDSAGLALLQSMYTGDTPNQTSAFVRLSLDGALDNVATANTRYNFETVGGASSGDVLSTLSITTASVIPEPSSLALLGLSGMALVIRRRK